MDIKKNEWWLVYLCGCTDCFPHAAFPNEKYAHEWAKENQMPEGYLIKKLETENLPKQMQYEE